MNAPDYPVEEFNRAVMVYYILFCSHTLVTTPLVFGVLNDLIREIEQNMKNTKDIMTPRSKSKKQPQNQQLGVTAIQDEDNDNNNYRPTSPDSPKKSNVRDSTAVS